MQTVLEHPGHVLTAGQFSPDQLFEIFARADAMRDGVADPGAARELAAQHAGKVVATVFYEPSTRTRLSFESAAQRLGMAIISTENAAEFSSAAKGETLEDSTRVLDGYAHAIVMRHKENGAAARAASVSRVPVINAGDGTGEHPTQALLDAYTIFREKGRLDNLNVTVGGDLARGRTARSLARILSKFPGNHISFVSTPELGMGQDVLDELDQAGTTHTETSDMFKVLGESDVVYWTRTQLERGGQGNGSSSEFVLGQAALDAMPQDAIIMHPLPRVGEITREVDNDPRAAYFRQAENGLYIRMALLDMLV